MNTFQNQSFLSNIAQNTNPEFPASTRFPLKLCVFIFFFHLQGNKQEGLSSIPMSWHNYCLVNEQLQQDKLKHQQPWSVLLKCRRTREKDKPYLGPQPVNWYSHQNSWHCPVSLITTSLLLYIHGSSGQSEVTKTFQWLMCVKQQILCRRQQSGCFPMGCQD